MGVCLAKHHQPQETSGRAHGASKASDTLAVSLERAKAISSNATATNARYHCVLKGSRKLADDYEVFPKKVLGEGCNGLVVMAKGRIDGRKYALKKIQKSKVHPKALRQLSAEVEIYLSLDHPHIATLRDVYETGSEIALLTECCEGGELYSRLSSAGTYDEADAAEATYQMLLAVAYLHSHNIVHRDLKLENFLYQGTEAKSPLKLIDFGFAKVWDPATLMMASCGSIAYVSPDVLRGAGYTNQCDLWSLGVIVFMLLVGYPPFHGSEKEMRTNILAAKVDWSHKSRWRVVSEDAVEFVKSLLVKDPQQRLSAKGALAHRWLLARTDRNTRGAALSKEALRSLKRYADCSRVKRAVLTVLAQELSPVDTRDLREMFIGLDSTGEGTISFTELKAAIRGETNNDGSPRKLSEPLSPGTPKTPAAKLRRAKSGVITELCELLDSNGDEQIYWSDFVAATMNVRTQLRQEAVRAAFTRLDADCSGSICVGDLRRVIGDTFEGVNVELLLKEADTSGKGQVNFDDFLKLLEEKDVTLTPKAVKGADTVVSASALLNSVH